MRIFSSNVQDDVTNCMSIQNIQQKINCIRTSMGYPVLIPTSAPVITNETVSCLRAIFDKYRSMEKIDIQGRSQLPYQTSLQMSNEVLTCLGMPTIDTQAIGNCMTNCRGIKIGNFLEDVSQCVNSCTRIYP